MANPAKKTSIVLVIGLTYGIAAIAEPRNTFSYDTDGNKRFLRDEVLACLYDQASISVNALKTSTDSDDLIDATIKKINNVAAQVAESGVGIDAKAFVEFCDTKDKKEILKKPKSFLERHKFLVRSANEIIDFGTNSKPSEKAKAASFSIERDEAGSTKNVTFSGAIIRPFEFEDLPHYRFVPSLSFSKLKNSPEPTEKDTDTLIFRFAQAWQIPLADDSPIQHIYVNASPGYATDSRFDSDVVSLELQVIPVSIPWALNFQRELTRRIRMRFRPVIHYELGDVRDAGTSSALDEDSNFSRVGLKLQLDLFPAESEAFSTSFTYEYLSKLSGDLRSRKLFAGEMNISLDEAGTYSLQFKYLNGDSSYKLEDEEAWSIGLGIRF